MERIQDIPGTLVHWYTLECLLGEWQKLASQSPLSLPKEKNEIAEMRLTPDACFSGAQGGLTICLSEVIFEMFFCPVAAQLVPAMQVLCQETFP
ncbi:hypothetical protein MHYP_G00305690 [Metynnis hypsauchen]